MAASSQIGMLISRRRPVIRWRSVESCILLGNKKSSDFKPACLIHFCAASPVAAVKMQPQRPDVLDLEWRFLADGLALVPRLAMIGVDPAAAPIDDLLGMHTRMRKRRPKPYPWLKVRRPHARHQVRKHGHDWPPK